MWRFTLPGFVIVGTLLLLLSGGLGLWHGASTVPVIATHDVVAPPEPPAPAPAAPPPVAPQTLQQATAPDPLQQRSDALQAQIEHRTQHLASLRADIDQAQRRLAGIQQQQQSVAASVAQQNKDLASLHEQLQAAHQQLDSLQQQQQAVAANIKQGNSDLAALHAQTDQARQQTDQARQQLAGAQQQQQATGTASADATQKLAALHQQIAEANRQLAALQKRRQAEAAPVATARTQPPPPQPQPQPQPQQQMTAAAPPDRDFAPAERTASADAAPPGAQQPIPAGPPQNQLTSARQQLAQGRPWAARRLLSMAQTQLAFQPVTPNQPNAAGGNVAATWVGEAIHWIDAGDTGRAYQAINRAIQLAPGGQPATVADTDSDRSAYPPGYDQRYYRPR